MKLADYEELKIRADKELKMPDTIEGIIKRRNTLPADEQKYTKLLATQTQLCADLEVDLAELYGKLYKCYKFPRMNKELIQKYGLTINEIWDTSKGIESQIDCVPEYIKLKKELNIQKAIKEFVQDTRKSIIDLGFAIKDYLDYKRGLMST